MVAIPALANDGDQPGVDELPQVPARRLRAHARMPRELACGQCTAVHERQENVRSGRIADQGASLRERVA